MVVGMDIYNLTKEEEKELTQMIKEERNREYIQEYEGGYDE